MFAPSWKAWTVTPFGGPEGGVNLTVAIVSNGLATSSLPMRTISCVPNFMAFAEPLVKWAPNAVGLDTPKKSKSTRAH